MRILGRILENERKSGQQQGRDLKSAGASLPWPKPGLN